MSEGVSERVREGERERGREGERRDIIGKTVECEVYGKTFIILNWFRSGFLRRIGSGC